VHLIHEAEHLRQAVRTAVDAGLLTVVAPASEPECETVRTAVAGHRLAEITPPPGQADAAAREILTGLENSGRLARSQGPLTDGAGI
jgi:hypothetical protein